MTYQEFRNWALSQPANTIGENDSDRGECLGLINTGEVKIHGLQYPIRDVMYAKDFLNGRNTRPDIYERVINDPNNYNQLPSIGDAVVLTVADWRGHTAYVNNPNLGNGNVEVLEQYHNVRPRLTQYHYTNVVGWWHIKTAPPVVVPPVDPTVALNAKIVDLNSQVATLTAKLADMTAQRDNQLSLLKGAQAQIDQLTKENLSLKAQVGDATKWGILKALIKELLS